MQKCKETSSVILWKEVKNREDFRLMTEPATFQLSVETSFVYKILFNDSIEYNFCKRFCTYLLILQQFRMKRKLKNLVFINGSYNIYIYIYIYIYKLIKIIKDY